MTFGFLIYLLDVYPLGVVSVSHCSLAQVYCVRPCFKEQATGWESNWSLREKKKVQLPA